MPWVVYGDTLVLLAPAQTTASLPTIATCAESSLLSGVCVPTVLTDAVPVPGNTPAQDGSLAPRVIVTADNLYVVEGRDIDRVAR